MMFVVYSLQEWGRILRFCPWGKHIRFGIAGLWNAWNEWRWGDEDSAPRTLFREDRWVDGEYDERAARRLHTIWYRWLYVCVNQTGLNGLLAKPITMLDLKNYLLQFRSWLCFFWENRSSGLDRCWIDQPHHEENRDPSARSDSDKKQNRTHRERLEKGLEISQNCAHTNFIDEPHWRYGNVSNHGLLRILRQVAEVMDTATSHIDDIRHDVSNRAEERRANASSEYKRDREENHIEIIAFETRGFGCGLKKN